MARRPYSRESTKSSLLESATKPIDKDEEESYKAAFAAFDWNHNGRISLGSLQAAMRRAGNNPTDVEVSDIVNRVAAELENTSGYITFQEFCFIMKDKDCGRDTETGYKEAFRAFSRDEEGCIPADEIKKSRSNQKGDWRDHYFFALPR